MCGIAGQVRAAGGIDPAAIAAMSSALRHRGPDGEGEYLDGTAGLGHRRLSFLDLSDAARQPLANEDGTLHITYNGEVYNYLELRKELVALGHMFRSESDTEVVLHGFEEWGADVLRKLKGMFAFGIWNNRTKELFLARDRFGIKPLYYSFDPAARSLVFASEIKALKAHPEISTTLDRDAFADFFVYRYVPSPKTIWKEIRKLPPAHYLRLEADGSIEIARYWSLESASRVISDRDAIERFDELLKSSVSLHARSDVPIGLFLSGGYDSSALLHYLRALGYAPDSFAIGFAGWERSEHRYAELVAGHLGARHHELILTTRDLDIIDHLAWVLDEPLADLSIIPTFFVSREAATRVKAVMSGEGGDELLIGYQWQKRYAGRTREERRRHVIRAAFAHLTRSPKRHPLSTHYIAAMAVGSFDTAELRKMLTPELAANRADAPYWFYLDKLDTGLPPLKAIQKLDFDCFLGELVLTKVDRVSMANSLEVRVPFLDHEICEFIFSLDPKVYHHPEETKRLLYHNIKHHLPREILERKKQGFTGPDTFYMNNSWYRSRLRKSHLVRDGLIRKEYVDRALDRDDHFRLWKLVVMEAWYGRWM